MGLTPEYLIIFKHKSNFNSTVKMQLGYLLGLDEQDSNYFIIDNALLLKYNTDQSELIRKSFFKIL